MKPDLHGRSATVSRGTAASAGGRPGGAPNLSRFLFGTGLVFLAFILYGSLVPFDFRPGGLDAAWRTFLNTPWLALGIESRADWVANLLLYIPLGFCFTAGLDGGRGRSSGSSVAVGIGVLFFGALVAVGIEFTQLFFPPRTVSLNDLVAELLGTAVGIGLWRAAGEKSDRLFTSLVFGGVFAIRAAVSVYVLGYLGLSLFPFDFVLNPGELEEKLAMGLYDPFVVRSACGGFLMCGAKLGAEAAAAAPVGLLMGLMLRSGVSRPYAKAFAAGCVLGVVVEVGQLFIVSGVSQGLSVLTRGLGFVAGIAVQRAAGPERVEAMRGYLRPTVMIAFAPYLVVLAALNGWFAAPWTDVAGALANLEEVRFLPFYYHYFTTESSALQSLLRIAAVYLPVGIGYCMWCAGARRAGQEHAWLPAVLAAVLAMIVEAGKLFVPGRRPDPTDVLIAAFSSYAAWLVATAILRWMAETPGAPRPVAQPRRSAHVVRREGASGLAAVWCFLLVIVVAALLVVHPFGGQLAAFLVAYALLLWRWPGAALPAVLALLPLLNFAPWTGWVLIDEFDLLVTLTIALWLVRRAPAPGPALPHRRAGWVIALLALSYALSAAAGLLPFQTFDQSALTSYYGSLNSLRVAKGFVWALALLPLIDESMRREGRLEQQLVSGVLLGLCGVVAVATCQRATMPGLLDFSTDYRIAATFPETHVGGGDVEAYLVMALPFAVAWIALHRGVLRVVSGAALFAAGSYVLAVTFARAGYLAYAGMLALLAVAFVLRRLRQGRSRSSGLVLACGIAIAAGAVMVPIVTSSFMQARFAATQPDGALRLRHWTEALDMMDPGARSALIGMGLGSYPKTYLLKNPAGAVPATFSYLHENGNGYVRLGSGLNLYLDQRVSAAPGRNYSVSLDLRSADPKAAVSVSLCEKTEQHAFQCKRLAFDVKTPGEKWHRETLTFESGEVGAGPWLLRPPVALVLSNPGTGTRVDVDNVSLREAGGRELIANGDFSSGGARWFFTTDHHVQWHADNVWVHVLFEQGWLGVLAFALAIMAGLARLAASTWRGDLFAATLLASLSGCLVVGFVNSVLDGPRVAAFFFVLLFTALMRPRYDANQKQTLATESHGNTRT